MPQETFISYRVYWLCPHSMRSKVSASVGCPSVRLSVRLSVPSGRHTLLLRFAAVGPAPGDIDRLLHGWRAGGQQQPRRSTACSGKCGQCHVVS